MTAAADRPHARPFLADAAAFAAGKDTPRAALDRCLAAVAAREGAVKAFVSIDEAGARAAADASTARWKSGKTLSAIDGLVIGVKDVIETASMPTQMGSALYAGWRSERDAASVRALKEAGAVILAKTVTTEFAATEPGPTCNPWDLARTPGGSSSGSAAGVAAGFIHAGLGTQVVGSILRPASYCGVVGFKPTVGAINRGGSHDHMSQSAQGVLAATLADAWGVLRTIADLAGGDPGCPGLYGPPSLPPPARPETVVVLDTPGWAEASDAAKSAFDALVARLRDRGVRIANRRTDPAVAQIEEALGRGMLLTRKINAWESRWPLNTYRDRDATKLSRTMVERCAEAEAMTLEEFRAHLSAREGLRRQYARLADIGAVCISLAAPGEAPVGIRATGSPSFVVAGSVLGVPAVSLPLLAANGLPLGVQVLGFEHEDARLLASAGALEDLAGPDLGMRA